MEKKYFAAAFAGVGLAIGAALKVGVDPGVKTGVAIVWDGMYIFIATMTITKAMSTLNLLLLDGAEIELYVEDPNKRKWYGHKSNAKQQGAGSIKRDYSIWSVWAKENNVKLHPVAPKDVGSLFDNEVLFKDATKWENKCSVHARDAARMVYRFVRS
jgi:hypothetical protein